MPATAAEAVELANNGALAKTRAITLRQDPDESDPRIVGYKFGPIPDYPAVPPLRQRAFLEELEP